MTVTVTAEFSIVLSSQNVKSIDMMCKLQHMDLSTHETRPESVDSFWTRSGLVLDSFRTVTHLKLSGQTHFLLVASGDTFSLDEGQVFGCCCQVELTASFYLRLSDASLVNAFVQPEARL
ncbi:uncharacterized protein V6R79_003184 [Siganus canaliculatus]